MTLVIKPNPALTTSSVNAWCQTPGNTPTKFNRQCRITATNSPTLKPSANNTWAELYIGRTHRSRYNMRRAAARAQSNIHHLVDELHRKLCHWLCETYRVIFLPKFEIRRMVKKGQRKLSRRTVRSLYALRHYAFRQRLMTKAQEYPWVQVMLVNESFTSKTCTHCGWCHPSLGGSTRFECQSCGRTTSRDVGGARNILLRQLGVLGTQLR